MSAVAEQPVYTPEDLLQMPEGTRFELVDGELQERKLGFRSSLVANKVERLIGEFVERHRLGWTPAAECGYRCFRWAPNQVRCPDASFIS